tara:strand:- start:608 stop:832 length:225 start_codon:yes stop_codon:yes gene_type:complete
MTTMTISAITCSMCDKVANFFSNLYRNIKFGMQMAANRRVARELVHLGFHQQKEMNQILQRMNEQAYIEYKRKQ